MIILQATHKDFLLLCNNCGKESNQLFRFESLTIPMVELDICWTCLAGAKKVLEESKLHPDLMASYIANYPTQSKGNEE